MNTLTLIQQGNATVIATDFGNRGLTRIAAAVAADFRKITGARTCDIRVAGTDDPASGSCANADRVIVAGVLGNGGFIDRAAEEGRIDVSTVAGRRECYRMSIMPDGGREILVIAGSDQLGAEYGLLKVSELCGVSPWHYWADVTPVRRESVEIDRDLLNITSTEPAVKLRGFFMNDEWPSLGNWAHSTFGGFNELFYEKVFDLLLRLRGNFLWPAMWTGVFSEDGKAFPTASAEMASELGITMGTSHHEPLFRAGEEFSHLMTDSNDKGYGKDWSYHANPRGLYEFWTDGVRRNRDFKSLITMGIRGERDSKILGENATLKDNIELLKRTITDQKEILSENGLADAPKVLALYKEVEDYYYGDETAEGLDNWAELQDTMLLLSDDNYGNLRTVPAPDKRDRKAGWGIYYHFDYHGGPISYEWVNSTPITKAWEQLTAAYTYGIRDLWVANVGDLRPCELPLSYFLSLAFDYNEWKTPNRTENFLEKWVDEQFEGYVDQNIRGQIARIIHEYTRMNGDRRPEAVHADTFRFSGNNEALHELKRSETLISRVEEIRPGIPSERADAFFGLVEYPALASANLRKMMIYTGMHEYFFGMKVSYANVLREKILTCIAEDRALMRRYNEEMSDAKWRHMMSSKHVAFVHWNDEGSEYPSPKEIALKDQGQTIVCLFESGRYASEGELELPLFSSAENSKRRILLLSTDTRPVCATIRASEDWIVLSERKVAPELTEIEVNILWKEIDGRKEGFVEISSGTGTVAVQVTVEKYDLSDVESGAFPETTGVISIPADAFSRKSTPGGTDWIRIDNYGKSGVSMKVLPCEVCFETNEPAPTLDYDIYILHPGRYFVSAYIAPTNNPFKGQGLRFAFSIDGETPVVVNTLPEGFAAGDPDDTDWCRYVLDNSRRAGMNVDLNEGAHTIRFIHLDAGVVLQKIEVARNPSDTFYGYRTTYRMP
ncbi:MAG: glycosyl hydrolase 115 family protein [Oscillospiraceae bacterium]|nr:glycosyl hydrolase 115 family protein [Oscillospiraceae bacterium]